MIRRYAVLVLGLLAGLVVQAFCAGSEEGASKPAERPKIVFVRSHGTNPYAMEVKPDDRYFKEVSRLSGYDFSYEYLDHANYNQVLSLRFASGELPDVIATGSVDSQYHNGAVQSGAFVDLTDLIPKYAPNMWARMPPAYWRNPNVNYKGRIYGIPWLQPLPAWRVVYYRKDWVDKLGMKPPVTLDDYLAVFARIRATDLDGNGKADEIAYGCRENFGYSDLPWGPFGVYPGTWRLRQGKLMPDLIAPEMKDALLYWKKLYENGYVNADLWVKKGTDWIKDIYSSKIGFWTHDVMNLVNTWSPDKFPKEAVVDVLPGAKEASGGTPLVPDSDAVGNVWVVNAKTKDPVAVVKFFDWLWSDDLEKERFFTFGIKGYNWTEENGKVLYDAAAPQNVEKNTISFIQVQINPRGDYRMNPLIVDLYPARDLIRKAAPLAVQSAFKHDGKNMPVLDAFKENPNLGSGAGSLFLDMAAKVITGKEDAGTSFAAFVAEWKKRGGDAAIEQANGWYAKR